MKEQDKLVYISIEGRGVQEIEALVIGEKRIGTMFEEEVDNVVMAAFGSPENGGSDGIPSFGVDVCAVGNEEMAQCIMIVDGSPLGKARQHLTRSISGNM